MNANLILLTLCQGLFFTNNVTFIAINGLVGLSMAPLGWMATLPVMGYVVGGALSTGLVAAALLGSEERLEYTVVGDTVNLTQRLQQWPDPGETVLSDPTWAALGTKPDADELEPAMVKGRDTAVGAHRFPRRAT